MKVLLRAGVLLAAAGLMLTVSRSAGGDKPDAKRFLEHDELVFEVNAVLDDTRDEKAGDAAVKAARHVTIAGRARLARVDDASPPFAHWAGTLEGTVRGTMNESSVQGEPKQTSTMKWEAQGPLAEATVDVRLDAQAGTYEVAIVWGAVQGTFTIAHAGIDPVTTDVPVVVSIEVGDPKKLPEEGLVITGKRKTSALTLPSQFLQEGFMKKPSKLDVSWSIKPAGAVDVELVVTVPGYDTWRPKAGASESDAGAELSVTAELKRKDGKPLTFEASEIRFELDTSSEPGLVLNFPPKGERKKDLRFLQQKNALAGVKVESETTAHMTPDKGGGCRKATAVLSSFDWGAWGELKVSAKVRDQTIVGRLESEKDAKPLLLPKRDPSSKIADAWRAEKNVTKLADTDDSEADPKGDGCGGDGFTLYEEYRGFHEDGERIELDPAKKDVFVRNEMAGGGRKGIDLYEELTGFVVHSRIRASELESSGRVNAMTFNRADGPHGARHQHAVVLREGPLHGPNEGFRKDGTTQPGTPRQFKYVLVSPPYPRRAEKEATIAHELLHAANVSHHGDVASESSSSWIAKDGYIYEHIAGKTGGIQNARVEVRRESDGVLLSALSSPGGGAHLGVGAFDAQANGFIGRYFVARQQGVCSGREDCVMRYYVAEAYVATVSTLRYLIDPKKGNGELPGTKLCDDKVDAPDGVNGANRKPHPRYGHADIGECKKAICINDQKH